LWIKPHFQTTEYFSTAVDTQAIGLGALPAAVGSKTSGYLTGKVIQRGDRLIDTFLRRGAHVWFMIDHPRHGFDRDARKLSDIKNGRFRRSITQRWLE
jgi:hypothetical protein